MIVENLEFGTDTPTSNAVAIHNAQLRECTGSSVPIGGRCHDCEITRRGGNMRQHASCVKQHHREGEILPWAGYDQRVVQSGFLSVSFL